MPEPVPSDPPSSRPPAPCGSSRAARGRSLAETREFFAPRAAGWEQRFPDDGPAYRAAVATLELTEGDVALDVGCGTGRALEPLRAAVGPGGLAVGVDATPEMLAQATRLGRHRLASLVLGDARRLPLGDGTVDAVFAAGLLSHLEDPRGALRELARVTRTGGRLAVFHPIGRVALAARHGRTPSEDDVMAPHRLRGFLGETGWSPQLVDDAPERYLALAERLGPVRDEPRPGRPPSPPGDRTPSPR